MPDQAVPLKFEIEQFTDVREGYVTLDWNTVDAASVYAVSDERSVEVFRGATPQAFVSGLPDGEHVFTVAAMDGQGQVLARSARPATVSVQHWPLSVALALFACGLVVLLAVIAVLVWGTRREASRSDSIA